MKIVCGSCGAKYSIPDEKVQGKVFKIRCKKCSDVIVVKGITDEGDLQSADSDFGASFGHSDGASEWYVVLDGEQVGPITPEEVEAYFSVGQLSGDSFVWREGLENWVAISSLSEFAHLIHMSGGGDEHTMIAASPHEAGGFAPPDDATAVIDSARFNPDLYGMGGQSPSYAAAPEVSGDTYESAGYSGYDSDPYGQAAPAAASDYSGYGSEPVAAAPSYHDSYQSQSGSHDDSYESDGGGGMFAAFDSAPAEESDYSGGFGGGGYGGGSQDYSSGDSGGLSGNASVSANDLVGARNENSVLFSLSSLEQVQAVSKPAGGNQPDASGGNDKSGLIDIQALASAHASMKGSGAAAGGTADAFAPSTMSMPALMPMPMGSHRNNKGLLMAVIIGGSLVFVGLIAVVVVLLTREPVTQTIITEAPVAQAAPAPAVPEVDPKLAAEAAEAARAALAAAEAPPAPAANEEEEAEVAEEAKAASDTRTKTASKSAPTKEKTAAVAAASSSSSSSSTSRTSSTTKSTSSSKSSSKGGIDDILGQIDSKSSSGGSKSSGSTTAAAAAPAGNVPARLTRPQVQSTIRQYNAQVLRCQQTSNSNKLSGTVNVRFTIQPSGSVSEANVQAAEFRGTDVGGCIENVVKGMKFPASQSDQTINYPFIIR